MSQNNSNTNRQRQGQDNRANVSRCYRFFCMCAGLPCFCGTFVCEFRCGRIETGAIETGYFNFRWQEEERGTEKTEGKEDRSK